MLNDLKAELSNHANADKARILSGFFKTGKGQYGEGDIFIGITVPVLRKIAKQYFRISASHIDKLLHSPYHEHRLCGLLIMVYQYERLKEDKLKDLIYEQYLSNTAFINNWDLVDLSAPKIVGTHLLNQSDRTILYKLAKSKDLWERRISIISTFAFIKEGDSKDTFAIARLLIDDKHDLIHKAVGWMLREVGKRISESTEKKFLDQHYSTMPRTMLRYAIERFRENERRQYLTAQR